MALRSFPFRLAAASALVAGLALSQDADAQQTKMAVVDVQRALALTEDGMRATATLKKLFEPRQLDFNRRQGELQKQKEDLDRQVASLSKAEFAQKMQDLQQAATELQAAMVQANKEFEKKQRELTDPIFEKIMGIVRGIATTDGYDLIVDRTALTYTRNDIDLTDKCIQMYNTGGGASPPTTTTPSPAATTAPTPVPSSTPAPPATTKAPKR